MSKTKKSFIILPLVIAVIITSFILSACGDKKAKFNIDSDIKTNSNAIISALTDKAYNKLVAADEAHILTFAELKQELSNPEGLTNYYVEIGSVENINKINSISLGGATFNQGADFMFSIGNNNFVKDKAFVVEDNKLSVAAPIIAFEIVNTNKISINGTEYDFAISNKPEELQINQTPTFLAGTNKKEDNTISAVENATNQFDVTIKDATEMLKFMPKNADVNSSTVYLRKFTNAQGNISYGLTKAEGDGAYGSYVVGYHTDFSQIQTAQYEGKNTIDLYLVDGGMATIVLNITLQNPQE